MKPIKLGVNSYQKNEFNNELRRITKLLSDFFAIADKYINTKNKNDFKGNLYKAFLDKIESQYRVNFPIISVEKICEFLEIELHQIRKISSDVSSIKIDIDYNTHEAVVPDFGIYATTKEQIEKVKELEPICDVLNKMMQSGKRIYPFDIIRGLGNTLSYQEGVFSPSVNYVLHSHRL